MTRRRQSGRPRGKRAVAYIRESTEEQGQGYSPDAQRDTTARFARDNELELVGEYLDLHSGWKGEAVSRPNFKRLMEDAAARKFDIVIVAHTSRFARNVAEARKYKTLLRKTMKIDVVSATQNLGNDPSDPNTFLGEAMSEVFDEYQSIATGFWIALALRRKREEGVFVGNPPFGYVRPPGLREIVVDEDEAALVREVFKRYAGGRSSYRDLAAWLNHQGARTRTDSVFTVEAVRSMLQNTTYIAYLGSRRDLSRETKGSWQPIIDEDLFDRVQLARDSRARRGEGAGRPSRNYALSRLLNCDRCGSPMHGTTIHDNQVQSYGCSGRKQGKGCDQPYVRAAVLEQQLADYIRSFVPPANVRKAVVRRLKAAAAAGANAENRASRTKLVSRLSRLSTCTSLAT